MYKTLIERDYKMEEKECNVITLEDNIEYTEVDKIKYNNNTYVFLSNLENPENFCIRKLINKNEEEYIIGLDSKEEFDIVLNQFTQKYTN